MSWCRPWGWSGISKSTVSEAVQGHRRTCRRVPEPPAHRRMALSLARRHLSEGAPGRTDRTSRRNKIAVAGQTPRDAVRSSASVSARPRPRHSGPSSFDPCAFAAWGASDWSSATRIQASKPPSPGSSKQPGNAVASTGCATPWPMSRVVSITVVAAAIRQAFDQNPTAPMPAKPGARSQRQLRPRWPKLADLMDASEHDVLAYMSFPRQASHQNCTARTRLNV